LDAAGLRRLEPVLCAGRYRAMEPAHARILAENRDLFAVCVGEDEVGDYNVTEAGWYAVDDGEKVVLGPFANLDECERAMKDRERLLH
jgi:hypothetical protein